MIIGRRKHNVFWITPVRPIHAPTVHTAICMTKDKIERCSRKWSYAFLCLINITLPKFLKIFDAVNTVGIKPVRFNTRRYFARTNAEDGCFLIQYQLHSLGYERISITLPLSIPESHPNPPNQLDLGRARALPDVLTQLEELAVKFHALPYRLLFRRPWTPCLVQVLRKFGLQHLPFGVHLQGNQRIFLSNVLIRQTLSQHLGQFICQHFTFQNRKFVWVIGRQHPQLKQSAGWHWRSGFRHTLQRQPILCLLIILGCIQHKTRNSLKFVLVSAKAVMSSNIGNRSLSEPCSFLAVIHQLLEPLDLQMLSRVFRSHVPFSLVKAYAQQFRNSLKPRLARHE